MKAELIPTVLHGDGRALDVGTDRILANNFNQYIDRKSAHQNPIMWAFPISGLGLGSTDLVPAFVGRIFLGMSVSSATIARTLTVAPFFRSSSAGNTGTVVISVGDQKPQQSPGGGGASPVNPIFTGRFSQATWSTTTTPYRTGDPETLEIAKNLANGFAWIVVGVSGVGSCYGVSMLIEGVREVR